MKIYTSVDDYCLHKIRIAIAATKQEIEIQKDLSSDEISKLDSAAKSMVMETPAGMISKHLAILRYISGTRTDLGLLGVETIDQAQIDQWLEFSWQELEVPLQLLLSLESGTTPVEVSVEERPVLEQKAKTDMINNTSVLDSHLSTRTFIVGEKLSLADISLYAAYSAAVQCKAIELASFPGLFRWFMTVGHLPAVQLEMSTSTPPVAPNTVLKVSSSSTGGKWDRGRTRVKELMKEGPAAIGKTVVLKGWIRTMRSAEKGSVLFVELTDGSIVKGLQLVLQTATTVGTKQVSESGGAGASLSVTGTVVASPAKGQTIEVHVIEATVLGCVFGGDKGEVGGKNYPMAKKAHSLEFLREKAHLRPRSKMFSSAMRVRHAMAYATHQFFNDRGFVYVHTPLITAADAEGAGEQFTVSTLLPEGVKPADLPLDKKGAVDFGKDFFGRRCCMTVSGQLNVETHACALTDVYTFGPTFRAENSHTARHLAEFWMIEPEICFATLADNMALAEDYVKHCTAYALEHCADDLHYFEHDFPMGEKGLEARLRNALEHDFARITYTEAVELLQTHSAEGKVSFSAYPNWGDDLGSEHERYISEKVFQRPTIVSNYPKGIKAFYMKLNDDNETVAAMDILVPKIGELIGGSAREDDLATLERRSIESGVNPKDLWWYNDLRRFGTVPHAGFGLGFERLIMFVTGLENIRDVISFPRVPGHADF